MANLNSQLASVNKIVGYAPGDGSCMHWSYLIASGQTPMFDDSPFGLDDANSLHPPHPAGHGAPDRGRRQDARAGLSADQASERARLLGWAHRLGCGSPTSLLT